MKAFFDSLIAAGVLFAVSLSAGAEPDIDESFNKIGSSLCQQTVQDKEKQKEFKSLKIKGSKLESVCLLTAKTALTNCVTDTLKIYKGFLGSKEKEKVSKMSKAGLQFCADYANVAATEIVNDILDKAVTGKIPVDEAVAKVVAEATK